MAFDPTMADYTGKKVDAGGIATHYIEAGEGDPVVLIHGGGPGADGYGNWYACLPRLAQSFRAIAVDMLGFGRTDKPDPKKFVYSQAARTKHMIDFLTALDAGPVNLVGNSMGGLTALCVAIERPELVRSLVLMGPAGIKTDGVPAAVRPLMEYDGTAEGMIKVIRALTHKRFPIDDNLVAYRVEGSNDPATRAATQATMAWVREQHGLHIDEDLIRSVKAPTLIIGGKDDPIVALDYIFRFLKLIPGSWGYVIPRCGHWVMNERPREFVGVCTRFFRQQAAKS